MQKPFIFPSVLPDITLTFRKEQGSYAILQIFLQRVWLEIHSSTMPRFRLDLAKKIKDTQSGGL